MPARSFLKGRRQMLWVRCMKRKGHPFCVCMSEIQDIYVSINCVFRFWRYIYIYRFSVLHGEENNLECCPQKLRVPFDRLLSVFQIGLYIYQVKTEVPKKDGVDEVSDDLGRILLCAGMVFVTFSMSLYAEGPNCTSNLQFTPSKSHACYDTYIFIEITYIAILFTWCFWFWHVCSRVNILCIYSAINIFRRFQCIYTPILVCLELLSGQACCAAECSSSVWGVVQWRGSSVGHSWCSHCDILHDDKDNLECWQSQLHIVFDICLYDSSI